MNFEILWLTINSDLVQPLAHKHFGLAANPKIWASPYFLRPPKIWVSPAMASSRPQKIWASPTTARSRP